MEIWKRLIYDGVDLGDFYEISNLGNVRNAKRKRDIAYGFRWEYAQKEV